MHLSGTGVHCVGRSGDASQSSCQRSTAEGLWNDCACIACMLSSRCRRQKLLGESGEVATLVQGVMQAVRDVHATDELMHFEWLGPFWELNEVRRVGSLNTALHFGHHSSNVGVDPEPMHCCFVSAHAGPRSP